MSTSNTAGTVSDRAPVPALAPLPGQTPLLATVARLEATVGTLQNDILARLESLNDRLDHLESGAAQRQVLDALVSQSAEIRVLRAIIG